MSVEGCLGVKDSCEHCRRELGLYIGVGGQGENRTSPKLGLESDWWHDGKCVTSWLCELLRVTSLGLVNNNKIGIVPSHMGSLMMFEKMLYQL